MNWAISIWIGGSWTWKPHHESLRDHTGALYYWSIEWGIFKFALVGP